MFNTEDFQVEVDRIKLNIIVRHSNGRVLFLISFPDGRPSLVLTRLVNIYDKKVWTSIPEGRMAEAQQIGPEIVKHFKNLK
jgi:hypothetical protein